MTHDEMMKACSESTFNDGDELMFHLSSVGVNVIPNPPDMVQQTGEIVSVDFGMMGGIYRGEDEQYWVLDVISVDPPVRGCRLLRSGVDFIGVKSTLDIVNRRLQ